MKGLRMKWISVKERLPEIDKPVLVFRGYDISIASVFEYTDGEKFWRHEATDNNCPNVTHWMPLPKEPLSNE